MRIRKAFITALIAVAVSSTAALVVSAQPRAATPPSAPATQRALVFVLTSGIEDIQAMNSVFRHAKTAAEQHKLQEVVVLVYGRGVNALDGSMKARPTTTGDFVRDAIAAGVRVKVCAVALEHMGVPKDKLDPAGVEIVPNAMATLVDYVARGAAVVKY